jgi:hypothetical protein
VALEAIKIILLCIVAAVVYGIVHDQITARVCVEYLTIGHPPVFDTEDPTLLGIGWGVIATWWAGLFLGIPLAIAARAGHRYPKRTTCSLLRPILSLLLIMAIGALVAGFSGWWLAKQGWIVLYEPMFSAVPPEKHAAFLADLWAHSASYLIGFIGGWIVIWRVWRSRRFQSP